MYREIEFRAKRNDTKQFVYGSLINRPRNYAENENQYSAIILFDKGIDSIYNAYLELEVIPETIGQFTGLKDKNGRKIYEGDILKSEYCFKTIHVVKFTDLARFSAVLLNEEDDKIIGSKMWSECEIIGNIHDNLELLVDVSETDG